MLRRLVSEEAGITMALTVIMIVLIGVMGAGLLVFVQGDLKSVIEVNQGQKASEMAEAGIQAARRQVLANSFPSQYNDASLPPSFSPDPANSEWAFDSASATCGGLPSGPGKCITTARGDARVSIRYLPPPTSPSGTGSRNDPKYAPENLPAGFTDFPDKRDYFRIDSEGYAGGAYRKIQAIYVTGEVGLPTSYFATKDVILSGNATAIDSISFFAKRNISGIRSAMLTGTDSSYGDWKNSYNNKARLARSGTGFSGSPSPSATGAAAQGTITYDPTTYHNTQTQAGAANSDRYKRIDFDSRPNLLPGTDPGPANPTPNYRFCAQGTTCWPAGTPQPADVITYPFNSNTRFDDKLLQSIAQQQVQPGAGSASSRDNYVEQSAGAGTVTIDQNTFYQVSPALSSVYVVRFTGATKGLVSLGPSSGSSDNCPIKGTILVINGDINTSSTAPRCFDGVISVQDPNNLGTLEYKNVGNFTLNGFVNIEGSMTISGSSKPILGDDILNQPGFHTVKLWSWRECYNTTCT